MIKLKLWTEKENGYKKLWIALWLIKSDRSGFYMLNIYSAHTKCQK